MTVPVDVAIQGALYGRLLALALPDPLPIAPEGETFDGGGAAYLRPVYMPGEVNAPGIALDGPAEHLGLYQIDVFWPLNGGVAGPLAVADAIRAHYARGLRLPLDGIDLRVLREPATLPVQTGALLQVPVRVPWRAVVSPA